VLVRDLISGARVATIAGHEDGVDFADVSPNGRLLLTGSLDRTIRLWELDSGRELWRSSAANSGPLGGFGRFTRDGARVIFEDGAGSCLVVDLTGGALLADVPGRTVAAGGDLMIVADAAGRPAIWRLGPAVATGATRSVSPAAAAVAATVPFDFGEAAVMLRADSSGPSGAASAGGGSIVLSTSSGAPPAAFSPNGQWMAMATAAGPVGSAATGVAVWHLTTGARRELTAPAGGITGLAVEDGGRRVIVVSARTSALPDDRAVSLLNERGQLIVQYHTRWGPPLALGFRRDDGRAMAVVMASGAGGPAGAQCVAVDGHQSATPVGDASAMISAAAFDPEGRQVAVCDVHGVSVYDTVTGARTTRVEARGHWPVTAAFCPSGHLFATGGGDRAVRVWEVATGKPLIAFTAHPSAIVGLQWTAGPSRIVATTSEHGTRLWDATPRADGDTSVVARYGP
jgi:WD40 repeat protein